MQKLIKFLVLVITATTFAAPAFAGQLPDAELGEKCGVSPDGEGSGVPGVPSGDLGEKPPVRPAIPAGGRDATP